MFNESENPGGSLLATGKTIQEYMKEYRKLGNHVKRYEFAKQFVKDKEVVEFGCGYGAGATLMNNIYKRYIGVDIDKVAIEYAQTHSVQNYNNARFELLSNFKENYRFDMADVVICYEVIEHVADTRGLLVFLQSLIKKNGIIILSTPNGLSSQGNKSLFRSEYHVHEFTPKQFYELCSEFGKVKLFGERRIDRIDVKGLQHRLITYRRSNSVSKAKVGPEPLYKSRILDMAVNHLNKRIFWKIYPTTPRKEENKLSCSTLLAIISK